MTPYRDRRGSFRRPARGRAAAAALVLLVLVGTALAAEAYLASFGAGGDAGEWSRSAAVAYDLRDLILFFLPLLLLPAAVLVLVVAMARGLWSRAVPRRALGLAGVLAASALLLIGLSWVGHAVRMSGFERAAVRMEPLVAAIGRFEREHGRPPATLGELPASYGIVARRFGVRGCRRAEYQAGSRPGEWELDMECPNGWITLDRFFYRPGERYASHEHHVRFGGWAYFLD